MDDQSEFSDEEGNEFARSYAEYKTRALALLCDHFRDEMPSMNIDMCVQNLASHLYANPYEGFSHRRDVDALESLKRALLTVSTLDLSHSAQTALLGSAYNFGRPPPPESQWENTTKYKILESIETAYDELAPVIDEVIAIVENDVDNTRNHEQRNHEGIQAILVCHQFWSRHKMRKAPTRGINLASPFGMFVQDYFELMEIEGSAASCFRAWMASNKRKDQVDT